MAPTTLYDLLPEISSNVLEILHTSDTLSVVAFAATSKWCYSRAAPCLFRSIKISLGDDPDIPEAIKHCRRKLQRDKAFKHVRWLGLSGETDIIDDGCEPSEQFILQGHPRSPRTATSTALCPLPEESDGHQSNPRQEEETVKNTRYCGRLWGPLADLMRELPGLTDFIWACSGQLPQSLLRLLHMQLPRCRLHMHKFKLHSLGESELDEYEASLITSPSLHSVRVYYEPTKDLASDPQWERMVVQKMAFGLTPNLKHVDIPEYSHPLSSASQYAMKNPFEIQSFWRGPPGGTASPLSSLQLNTMTRKYPVGIVRTTYEVLRGFTKFGDLSELRFLSLGTPKEHSAIRFLTNLFSGGHFSNLRAVKLNLDSVPRAEFREYALTFSAFFANLPGSISTLDICGEIGLMDQRSRPFLSHLGQNLRSLRLVENEGNPVSEWFIEHVAEGCPRIETFAVRISRSGFDHDDWKYYSIFGTMIALKHLELFLDTSDVNVMDDQPYGKRNFARNYWPDWFSEQEWPYTDDFLGLLYRQGHIRDVFIGSAVDEDLVRSMFRAIDTQRQNLGEDKKKELLQTLRVRMDAGFDFGHLTTYGKDLSDVLFWLGRSWYVRRHPALERQDELIIKHWSIDPELDKRYLEEKNKEAPYLRPATEAVFRSIWPAKEDSNGDWRKDWHSFPLDRKIVFKGKDYRVCS